MTSITGNSELTSFFKSALQMNNNVPQYLYTNDLFFKGVDVNTAGTTIDIVLPPSTLDAQGVSSAEIEASGSDYLLTITLYPEADSKDIPSIYNAQCVNIYSFIYNSIDISITGGLKAFEDRSFNRALNYSSTEINATIGSDGVLKELVTYFDYNGTISSSSEDSEISSVTLDGSCLSDYTFSYNF